MLIITIPLNNILQHPAQNAPTWQCCLLLEKPQKPQGDSQNCLVELLIPQDLSPRINTPHLHASSLHPPLGEPLGCCCFVPHHQGEMRSRSHGRLIPSSQPQSKSFILESGNARKSVLESAHRNGDGVCAGSHGSPGSISCMGHMGSAFPSPSGRGE